MKLQKRNNRIAIYIFLVTILMVFIIVQNRSDNIVFKIDYSNGMVDDDSWNALIVDMGNGYLVENIEKGYLGNNHKDYRNEIIINLPKKYNDFKSLIIKLEPDKQIYSIKCIEVFNHNTLVYKFGPNEMLRFFTLKNIDQAEKQQAYLIIRTEGSDPLLESNEEFEEIYNQIIRGNTRWIKNILIFGLLIICLMIYADYNWNIIIQSKNLIKKRIKQFGYLFFQQNPIDMESVAVGFCKVVLIISAIFVVIMAVFSPIYSHADEPVYRAAIDFYTGKWLPERIDSNLSIGTFSGYGYSRLDEPTWYYLVAGKIAWIAKCIWGYATYYRMGNVVIYIALIIFLFVHSKNSKGIILSMCLTPQIWYLFSYPTSDAWDLLWSYIAIYEVCADCSCLNKYLQGDRGVFFKNLILSCAPFAFILGGKVNFYLVLLLVFVILLLRLFEIPKNEVAITLLRYLSILFVTFLMLGVRTGIDKINYGPDRRELVRQETYINNVGDGIPDMIVAENNTKYTIKEVIKKGAIQTTFSSSIGGYGWLEYMGDTSYICFMLVGIILIVVLIIVNSFTLFSASTKMISISLIGYIVLMYAMVIYNCAVADFQPQGRYTMPLFPIIGYILSRQMKEKRLMNIIGVLVMNIAVFSLYSFFGVGLYNIVIAR